MLCFLYRFSVVKTVRLHQWICVFLRFLVFLYKYFFFFEESSNATNWNTIFRSDEHVFIWTTFISQFFRLLIYFKFWQFVSFLWAYIPSFKKKPIIFAWNKRPGFYLFHVKNHRMLGIINHQDEKLAAWILIPCAEKCSSRLDFHFFWWYLWVIHPTNLHLSHKQNWKNYFFFILNLKTDASTKTHPHE